MEITENVRRAVLAAECARLGHQIDYTGVISWRPDTGGQDLAETEERLPHITCSRCEAVLAIMVPTRGRDYEDAERIVYGLLRPDVGLAKEIVRKRGRRHPEVLGPRPEVPEPPVDDNVLVPKKEPKIRP